MASLNLNLTQPISGASPQNKPNLNEDHILKRCIQSRRGKNSLNDNKQFLNAHCIKIKEIVSKIESDVLTSDRMCPITHDNIKYPVRVSCGHIFEQHAIKQWFQIKTTGCPICRSTEASQSNTDEQDQETLNEITAAADSKLNIIGERIGVKMLKSYELDRIQLELGGISDDICEKVDHIGKLSHWFNIRGIVDTPINLTLIFPNNTIGSDPFSSILKTSYLQFLPFVAGSSVLSMSFIRHHGEKYLTNQSSELKDIYNSIVSLDKQYWSTNENILHLKNELRILLSEPDENIVNNIINAPMLNIDRIKEIKTELDQLNDIIKQILDNRNQLTELPNYASMLDQLRKYSNYGALSTFLAMIGLQTITNKIGESINNSNDEITNILKEASQSILDICKSKESKCDKEEKFNNILLELDKVYQRIWGWTAPLKLNYFMLSSFIHLVLGNFDEALKLITNGLQINEHKNNPFLLYNKIIAYLANGNRTGAYETLNQLKKTNLVDIAVRFESYLNKKDKVEQII